jgi:uncharacterized protein (DUF362 family)
MAQRCTRRALLRQAGYGGLALAATDLLTGCTSWPLFHGTDSGRVAEPPVTPTDQPARVVAVKGSNLADMARAAIAAFGGMQAIVQPGETVFLKPNLVGAGAVHHPLFSTGEATKPEIVVAVAEECLRAGAAEVIIGDGAQVRRFDWDTLLTLDGSTSLAAEAVRLNALYPGRVTLACLNADSPEWDALPSPYSGLEEVLVSSLVARADRIISLPVLKTHRFTRLTLALKNFMGVTSLDAYAQPRVTYRVKLHDAPGGLEQTFVDVVAALKPDFTLIDGSIGCEGDGPYVLPGAWGTSVNVADRLGAWLMLASNDLVAADATAARILGQDPSAVGHIQLAYDRGLGQMRAEQIQLDGAPLDKLRMDWQPATLADNFSDVAGPGLALALEGNG